jgi:sugar phosphate isomerase/epimerase
MNDKAQPIPFGVSQYTTWHHSFEEDVRMYAELGAEAIEVCEFKLDPARTGEQLRMAAGHGLTVTSVQGKVHTVYPDALEKEPESPGARMGLLRNAIARMAPDLPRNTPFIVNTGAAPNGDMLDGWETVTKELRALSDFTAGFGMRVAIEPLSPTDINRNTFIWTIPQALELVDRIGRDNFGVCIDTWNVWQDPLAAEHIAACGDRIFAVQLSDWRLPRMYSDRHIVGEGEIPFPPLLRAVRESGYSGAYTLEIFSSDALPDSLWRTDGRRVIRQSLNSIEEAWRKSL